MKQLSYSKIAIVHDFLVSSGGAEKVLEAVVEMFPDAPIYTLLYDEEKMHGMFSDRDIRTSFLQKFPKFLRKRYRWLLPFCAPAVESLNLRDFDLVISSSGAWSKGIVTRLKTKHIAYVHSPMRFVWEYSEKYWKDMQKKPSVFTRMFLSYLRVWDHSASKRPDALIANSLYTKKRLKKYYGEEATVIYPPVEMCGKSDLDGNVSDSVQKYIEKNEKKYFLVVSRLTENKRIDIPVSAFSKLNFPLAVVGEGRGRRQLESFASKNVEFFDWQDKKSLQELYRHARVVLFPTEDDFGIVPVEAMQCGVPVIAYGQGGATETVKSGVTGEFFDAQTPDILADAIRHFLKGEKEISRERIQKEGSRYGKRRFQKELLEAIKIL